MAIDYVYFYSIEFSKRIIRYLYIFLKENAAPAVLLRKTDAAEMA